MHRPIVTPWLPVLLCVLWAAPGWSLLSGQETLSQPPISNSSIHRTMRPAVDTLLSVQTTPKALCTLYPNQLNDTRHRLRLDADDQGVVRVHAQISTLSAQPAQLSLDCTQEDGRSVTYPLEVQATQQASAQEAADQALSFAAPIGTLRPALPQDQQTQLTLTDRQLMDRGYPPRPDPEKYPSRYASWLKQVSRPMVQVNPRLVEHPEITRTPQLAASSSIGAPTLRSPSLPLPPPAVPTPPRLESTTFGVNSSNWSGAVVTHPDVRFYQIQSDLYVPLVLIPPSLGYGAAAEWIGLDNAGDDLLQSGTDSQSFSYDIFGTTYSFTTYSVWIESLPAAPYFLPNFPISPGDEISISIFLADQYGTTWFTTEGWRNITAADNKVWFMIDDLTRGESYWGYLPRPSTFTGSSVEYIVERPTVNGSYTNLAFFIGAIETNCWFADTWYGYASLDYNGSFPLVGQVTNWTMKNGSDELAIDYIYANANSPGGGNVLWYWTGYN